MSEPNKQIDYGTLKWFDCQSYSPPMNTNLYVDSEHGFGIGRLGKRVKDGSTIWSVHLDSGRVYLVYAFYKVKRWAYMEEEKTNTKLKPELMLNKDRSWVPCYIKSEADKVIAELEKDVEAWIGSFEASRRVNARTESKLRHSNYKRCLAMAKWCGDEAYIYKHGSEYDEDLAAWFGKWHKRWMELAEKFKAYDNGLR